MTFSSKIAREQTIRRRTLKLLTKLDVIRCHMTKVERSL